MCGKPVTAELMAAVLGRQRLGGKKEVVLLPAAGGYFSYAPILTALQSTQPLPLARYILHGQGSAGASTPQMPVLLHGELVGGTGDGAAGPVQVSFRPPHTDQGAPMANPEVLASHIWIASPSGCMGNLSNRVMTI